MITELLPSSTQNMKDIIEHFKAKDPKIYEIMKQNNIQKLSPISPDQYFLRLTREIIYQQLHGKAAKTIFERITKLFPQEKITPEHMATLSIEDLRACGASNAKANYVKNIADAVLADSLPFHKFSSMSDSEIKDSLVAVKGIGPRTAEMFLMFSMGREDVFSFGDLGLRKGIEQIYNIPPKASKKDMKTIVEVRSPYKTYGALALRSYVDTD